MHQWIEDFRFGWRIESRQGHVAFWVGVALTIGILILTGIHATRFGVVSTGTIISLVALLFPAVRTVADVIDKIGVGANIRKRYTHA